MSIKLVEGVHQLCVDKAGFMEMDELGNCLIIDTQTQEIIAVPPTPEVTSFFSCKLDMQADPNDSCVTPTEDTGREVWSRKMTWLLVKEYGKLREKFRNPEIKNKNVWVQIQTKFMNLGYNVSIENLDRKFRNLKKTFKTIKDKSNKSGEGRITWEYFDEMNNIMSSDVTFNLPETVSSLNRPSRVENMPGPSRVEDMPGPSRAEDMPGPSRAEDMPGPSRVEHMPGPSRVEHMPGPSRAEDMPGLLQNVTGNTYPTIGSGNVPQEEEEITPLPQQTPKRKKKRDTQLNDFRKQQLEMEIERIEELRRIRVALEANLMVQRERNEILKKLVENCGSK